VIPSSTDHRWTLVNKCLDQHGRVLIDDPRVPNTQLAFQIGAHRVDQPVVGLDHGVLHAAGDLGNDNVVRTEAGGGVGEVLACRAGKAELTVRVIAPGEDLCVVLLLSLGI